MAVGSPPPPPCQDSLGVVGSGDCVPPTAYCLLSSYYFHHPHLILVPIEHLTPAGMSRPFAALLRARCGWGDDWIAMFDRAFSLYWSRTLALAQRTRTWAPPRLRHVGIVRDRSRVRPYAQLLNTSAWTVYECDFDPGLSNPELGAYVLVHGDRMALLGEVSLAAVHNAAYWFERTATERAAFAAAAARSPRPDADAYRALAEATEWLARLHHETLRPPSTPAGHRAVPGTGLLVPDALVDRPPDLTERWAVAARGTLRAFHAAWRAPDRDAVAAVCEWLVTDRPPLLVTAGDRILWEPERPSHIGVLRELLKRSSGTATRDVDADLHVVAAHTRTFLTSLADPDALPAPAADTEQRGYAYMHRTRRLIAYNLHEPGIERLAGPALPYARAMLGARTLHEWAHLAVLAGWVPCAVPEAEFADLASALANELDATIRAAPPAVRDQTAGDLAALRCAQGDLPATQPGTALAALLLARLPDYQANLLATRFMSLVERETYVRHNIRTLRPELPPSRLWRLLVRYLYEFQYLRFSEVGDRCEYFVRSTWFDADFLASGVLTAERFDALAEATRRLCAAHRIDERRVRPPA